MTTLSNYMKGGEDLNARRKSIISLAFSTMDTAGSGVIEPEVLLSTYNAAKHPDVISKKMSEESALSEFLNSFDVGSDVEGKVTRREFERFYKKISSSTADDEKFEAMIRGLYGIDGQGNYQTSATSRLMARNDAQDNLNTSSARSDLELEQQANNIRENSRAVLGKLVSNNSRGSSDLSSSMLEMTLNSSHPDGVLQNDSTTLAIAAAGPNAPSQSPAYPPRTAFPTPVVAIPAGVAHIVSKLKAKLRSYGVYGFVGLQRAIRSMDKADKRRISMADFKVAMRKAEVGLTDAEVRMLFDYFNNEHRGSIDTDNFVTVVRSVLNDRRLILVKQAFSKLDLNGEGAIDAGKLAELYDAAAAPDVIAGRATAEDNLYEFLETFDVGGEVNGMVTISEFVNYYTNIGSCVDNDEYFEVMLRNAWHLGGERQETSKRVLVTRKDGSQVQRIMKLLLFLWKRSHYRMTGTTTAVSLSIDAL
jgi:calcyphosin